jgi:hypothetical protein
VQQARFPHQLPAASWGLFRASDNNNNNNINNNIFHKKNSYPIQEIL